MLIAPLSASSFGLADLPAQGIALRRFLARLVWLAVLPLMLLGALLSWWLVHDLQHRFEAEAQSVARAAAASIDRVLRSRIHGLSILAESDAATEPERLPELYALAQSFRRAFGAHVIVVDLQMRLRLNTREPLGAPPLTLLRPKGRAAVPIALQTGQPAVGDSVTNPRDGQLLIAIAVPVMRAGQPRGVVLCTVDASEFRPFFDEVALPKTWSIAVHDSVGTAFGGRGPLTQVAPSSSAVSAGDAGSRLRYTASTVVAPWSVVVAIPPDVYRRPAVKAALGLAGAGLLATAMGVAAGNLAGRRLTLSLRSLLQAPGNRAVHDAAIAEVAAVRQTLDEAARQRQEAKSALEQRERDYRLMFDRNPNPMWVFDRATLRFLAVNHAAIERYGFSRDEFMAMTIAQIRPPEEVPALVAAVGDPARSTKQGETIGRFVHQTKTGERLTVEVSISDLEFTGHDATLVLVRDVTDRVRAEQERDQAAAALTEREERLRLFFEDAPAALAMFDREMRYVAASRRWRVDYNLGDTEPIGRSHYEIFPEIGDELKALHQRGLQGEVMRADEDRFVRADGRVQWLRWEMRPWHAAGGAIGGIAIFSEDITERMQALEALRASERNFRALAEQMPGIVYRARLDPPGHTEYVSPQMAELGFTPAQWIDQPELLWNAIHPDDRDRVHAETAAVYAGLCDDVHLEYRFRDAKGDWRYRSDHARVIRPPHEAPFVLGVNVDVTRARAAEAALHRSEQRFRTLAEQMPAVIYIAPVDASQPAVYVSPAITSLGYTPQQWTSSAGPNWQQALHPDDRARVMRQLGGSLVAGEVVRLEFRLRDTRGDWHDFVEYGCRVEGERGEPLMQGVMIDVSDFKRTQRELQTSRGELSELAQRLLTQERETARHLAQTLHDHLGQSLAVARLHLDATTVRLGAALPREMKDDCTRVTQTLDQAIADVRMVLGELRPPLLEDQGLIAALDTELRPRRSGRDEVDVLLEVDAATMAVRWSPAVEYGAFMIAREAVVNALLHADATLVRVIVEGDGRWLTLKVIDDGRGIADDMRQGRPGHLGLVGMRERALGIGARLDIEGMAEGGTCVALHWHEEPSA